MENSSETKAENIKVDDSVFSLLTNQVLVTKIGQILATITVYPKMEWMGPYNVGGGRTKVVTTHRIVTIPHSVVLGLFLACPNSITPHIII